ncbi:J domain-containing protein [Novosphingobium sp. Leaf2]|uniref:J domain-containing protein n=1 Tax=Novosphingobium sp. Leaf2 TaxID=1735670 RepID=UPI0006FEDFE0|nr:J domain-containing protein [Novosphingobium sp. Leaf2]KQM20284.1 molecular chaperone DnaJ [Novosphingobium sp. Leaf2]
MLKLVWLIALGCIAWRLYSGRWPWQPKLAGGKPTRSFEAARARALLGVAAGASRRDIVEAHRRRIAAVHPDRGGSAEQVHEANAARDLLLAQVPAEI